MFVIGFFFPNPKSVCSYSLVNNFLYYRLSTSFLRFNSQQFPALHRTYILMDHCYQPLSVDITLIVHISKKCPSIGQQVMVISLFFFIFST